MFCDKFPTADIISYVIACSLAMTKATKIFWAFWRNHWHWDVQYEYFNHWINLAFHFRDTVTFWFLKVCTPCIAYSTIIWKPPLHSIHSPLKSSTMAFRAFHLDIACFTQFINLLPFLSLAYFHKKFKVDCRSLSLAWKRLSLWLF